MKPMSEQYRTTVDPEAPNNPHSFAISMVGSGNRVLELGCSVGYVTEHLVARGNDVVGVEIDSAAAEEARRFATRVHVLDLDLLPVSSIEPGPFDVVLLGDVIEHLRDPVPVLRDLAGVLAPDGRFVISIPHVAHIDVRLMLLQGRWEYQQDGLLDRTHLRWFTRDGLRGVLAEVGFVATRVERVVFGLGASLLPVDVLGVGPDIVRFAEADPEAYTYQFVVEARRAGPGVDDALAVDDNIEWPRLSDEMSALRSENLTLRNEVEAWRRSRLVRLTAPLRTLRSKLARGTGS